MKKQLLQVVGFICVILLKTSLFAQTLGTAPVTFTPPTEKCASILIHEQRMASDPDYALRHQQVEQFIANYTPEKVGGQYRIPVVVHIVYYNSGLGTALYNITDNQVRDAIKKLNRQNRNLTGSPSVDTDIEFSLAVRDPSGNCTTGITRDNAQTIMSAADYTDYSTNGVEAASSNGIADATIKAVNPWDPTKYFNIWLVPEFDNNNGGAGVQGYAALAGAHGTASDGSVMLGIDFINQTSTTLVHELGHSFNLYHTFQGDGTGSTCPTDAVCGTSGDCVADTPPHKRSNSDCNAGGTNTCTGGSNALFVYNYMDYSSCPDRFTAGQVTRMQAAASGTRASFLAANGNNKLVPPSNPGITAIRVDKQVVCSGSTVQLFDATSCSPNDYLDQSTSFPGFTYSWSVTNGTQTYTSTNQNPTFTPAVGTYTVTFSITHAVFGTITSVTNAAFTVVGTPVSACSPTSSNVGNYGQCVNNVTFNTINNNTSVLASGGYQNLLCTYNTAVTAGNTYSLSVGINAGGSGPEYVEVDIDWNNDGDFADAGENALLSGNVAASGSTTLTQNITIPATAVQSVLLRMRVMGETNAAPSAAKQTCSSAYFIGDIEDYGILVNPAGCLPGESASPVSTVICENTSTSFSASFNNSPTSYVWQVSTNGGGSWTNLTNAAPYSNVTTTTLNITNAPLTLNGYVYRCVATNGCGSTNSTAALLTVLSGTASSLPLSEGFVSATFPPTGWSILNANSSTTWVRTTDAGNTPTTGNSMMFDNYNVNDSDDDEVRVKAVSLSGYTTAQLQFDVAYAPYDASNYDGLQVFVSTNCGGSWTSVYNKSNTTLATATATTSMFTPTAAQWRTETVSLNTYVGQANVIVAFRNMSGYGNRLFIDNVNITGSAPATASFTASPSTVCVGQTVTVTDASTGASSWNWDFGSGATPATANTVGPHSVTYSTAGTKTITLTINGSVSTTQTVTVNPLNTITAGANRTTCINSAITNITCTTTGATGATFSGLPAGVTGSWASNTVTISGTPTASGTFNYTVTTTGGCTPATTSGTITVTPLNTITAGANRTTCINSAITNITMTTTGATGATVTGLPAGVTGSWAANTVTISGTPTASGTFNYTVTTTGGCPPATTTGTITVNPANTITAGANRTTCINSAITNITMTTTGATGATVTGLPAGVTGSWASNTVTISGTPTASGTFNYTVTTTGGCPPATTTGTITVTPLNTITAGANQTVCINSAMTNITMTTTGATGATFSGLPAGVTGSWASNTVTISGTPTASGTFNYTVTTTGGCPPATATGTITVNPANTITAGANRTTCINTAITNITCTTTGATGATFSGLPTGVTGSWASNTVTISGTPTASGTFNYTVTTTGGCPPATTTGTITVNPANTITAGANRTTCINSAITNITMTTTGATGATVTGLPAGVTGSWAANTVTISGTPTVAGTFNYTVTTTGGCPSGTATGTITVNPANTVAAGTNQSVCINTPMTNITLATTGATGATFSGLPTGVTGSWASNTVTISGTPTAAGTFNYTVTTTGGCPPATTTGTITVTSTNTITAGSNQTVCINNAMTNITMTTTGATGATFSGLPAGVTGSWASNTATISGTPTASGTFNYTVTTTGGCAAVNTSGTITVTPANTITAGANRTTCINSAITNITMTTTGATGATFSGLPAGVTGSWASNTVTISGTPTASGTFNYTVTTTGGCPSATATGTITVNPANTITAGANQTVCINSAMTNITMTTTGATGATFSGLPAGVTGSWAANTVTISGTPTASGTFNYTVTTTGGCPPATTTGTITVNPANTITAGANQTVCINSAMTNITMTTTGATGATFSGLPAGVTGSWAANTVTISGTPTASGTFNYTVTTTGGCPPATATGTITVNPANTITAGANRTTCINSAITSITCTTTGATGATFTGLPTGVTGSWASNTATISGTPTVAGTFNYTITTTGGCPSTTATGTITVNALPATPTINPGGSTTFCAGGSVTLTSSAASGNTWSTTETTPSIVVTTSGTYTVTETNGAGCSATSAPTTVTVNAVPSTPVITPGGSTTFCVGGSVTLTSSAASGNTWSTTETTPSIVVTTSGTYTVTETNGAGCSATSAPTTVTVNAVPSTPVITPGGSTTFCAGGSVTLTSSAASGNTWSTTETTPSIVVTTSGTYTVTETNGAGCSATSAPTTVTVNAVPSTPVITPGGSTTFCAGGSVTLTSSAASGNTWSTTEMTPSIVVTTSGTYTVTETNGAGCSATSAPTVVTVNALPNVSFGSVPQLCVYNSPITLIQGSPSGGTYSGTGVSGGQFDPATAGVGTIPLTYTYTDGNGCSASAQSSVVVDGCVGISEEDAALLSVYPNPSTGIVTVDAGTSLIQSVQVFNHLGQLVLDVAGTNDTKQELKLETVANGVYTLRITTEERVHNSPIVIER